MLTHKKIVRVRIRSANFEKFHEIVELTVDISAHRHRAFLRVISDILNVPRHRYSVLQQAGHLIPLAGFRVPIWTL